MLWKAKQYLGAISQVHIAAFGLDNACAVVLDDCAANGLTGIHDPGIDPGNIALFSRDPHFA